MQSDPVYFLEYTWKSFRVCLPDFHAWCKANAGIQYCGLAAGCLDIEIKETFWSTEIRSGSGENVLRIHFAYEPGIEIEESIEAKWDSLTEEGERQKWKNYI